MNTLKKLEKRLLDQPDRDDNLFFKHLVEMLCLKGKLDTAELYASPYDDFKLALDIMKDWRIDQYTKTKERLRDLVMLPPKAE